MLRQSDNKCQFARAAQNHDKFERQQRSSSSSLFGSLGDSIQQHARRCGLVVLHTSAFTLTVVAFAYGLSKHGTIAVVTAVPFPHFVCLCLRRHGFQPHAQSLASLRNYCTDEALVRYQKVQISTSQKGL